MLLFTKRSIPNSYQSLRAFEQNRDLLDFVISKVADRATSQSIEVSSWKKRFRNRLVFLSTQLEGLVREKADFIITKDNGHKVAFFEYLQGLVIELKDDIESLNSHPLDQINACFTGSIRFAFTAAYKQLSKRSRYDFESDPALAPALDWLLECCFDTYRVVVPEAVRADICSRRLMQGSFGNSGVSMSKKRQSRFIREASEKHLDIQPFFSDKSSEESTEEDFGRLEKQMKIAAYLGNLQKAFTNHVLSLEINDKEVLDKLMDLKSILKQEVYVSSDLISKMELNFLPTAFDLYANTFDLDGKSWWGSQAKQEDRILRNGLIQFLSPLMNLEALPEKSPIFNEMKEGYGGLEKTLEAFKKSFKEKLDEKFGKDFFISWSDSDAYTSVVNVLIKINPQDNVYTFCQVGEEGQIIKELYSYFSGGDIEKNIAYFAGPFEKGLEQIEFNQEDFVFYKLQNVERKALDEAVSKWSEDFENVSAFDFEDSSSSSESLMSR